MKVDYLSYNFCAGCRVTMPKIELRCPDCRASVRTKARGTSMYN